MSTESEAIELVAPCEELWPSFLAFGEALAAEHPEPPRLWDQDAYLAVSRASEVGSPPVGLVPQTERWIVLGGAVIGFVHVRHRLTDSLDRFGGHIGYSVHPEHRGRGIATEALRQALDIANDLGIQEAIVTCDDSNIASKRVIEKNRGSLTGTYEVPPRPDLVCRYVIDLTQGRL